MVGKTSYHFFGPFDVIGPSTDNLDLMQESSSYLYYFYDHMEAEEL